MRFVRMVKRLRKRISVCKSAVSSKTRFDRIVKRKLQCRQLCRDTRICYCNLLFNILTSRVFGLTTLLQIGVHTWMVQQKQATSDGEWLHTCLLMMLRHYTLMLWCYTLMLWCYRLMLQCYNYGLPVHTHLWWCYITILHYRVTLQCYIRCLYPPLVIAYFF